MALMAMEYQCCFCQKSLTMMPTADEELLSVLAKPLVHDPMWRWESAVCLVSIIGAWKVGKNSKFSFPTMPVGLATPCS